MDVEMSLRTMQPLAAVVAVDSDHLHRKKIKPSRQTQTMREPP